VTGWNQAIKKLSRAKSNDQRELKIVDQAAKYSVEVHQTIT